MALTLKFADGDTTRAKCPTFCLACGGSPPYTFSTTKGSITILSANSFVVEPPSNPGSAESGNAYGVVRHYCANCIQSPCTSACTGERYGCDGQIVDNCDPQVQDIATCCGFGCTDEGAAPPGELLFEVPGIDCGTGLPHVDACNQIIFNCICDLRTQDQIDAGCNPCPISLIGAIVSVTDKDGTTVSRTLTDR